MSESWLGTASASRNARAGNGLGESGRSTVTENCQTDAEKRAVEAERALVGALLVEPAAVAPFVDVAALAQPELREIATVALGLGDVATPLDVALVLIERDAFAVPPHRDGRLALLAGGLFQLADEGARWATPACARLVAGYVAESAARRRILAAIRNALAGLAGEAATPAVVAELRAQLEAVAA